MPTSGDYRQRGQGNLTRLAGLPRPLRLWYEGHVFQGEDIGGHERVQEELQSGIELIGAPELAGDGELVAILLDACRQLPFHPTITSPPCCWATVPCLLPFWRTFLPINRGTCGKPCATTTSCSFRPWISPPRISNGPGSC